MVTDWTRSSAGILKQLFFACWRAEGLFFDRGQCPPQTRSLSARHGVCKMHGERSNRRTSGLLFDREQRKNITRGTKTQQEARPDIAHSVCSPRDNNDQLTWGMPRSVASRPGHCQTMGMSSIQCFCSRRCRVNSPAGEILYKSIHPPRPSAIFSSSPTASSLLTLTTTRHSPSPLREDIDT